jgi:hypothetical protein
MVPRIALCTLLLCASASAGNREPEVLGGPCRPEGSTVDHGWHALVTRYLQEERRGDIGPSIETAKQIVRGRCSSEHWWLQLAESLTRAGRIQEAIATLEELYERRSNAVEERLRSKESPLRKLAATEEFRRSDLAPRLSTNREALRKRLANARARLAEGSRPPQNYIAKNACPFECCGFGTWRVTEDTVLYDRPGGNSVLGRVRIGESVEALTGEVHLHPRPVRVRFAGHDQFPAEEGQVVFLLDYLGEGMGRVWLNGKVFDMDITAVRAQCTFAGPGCWGEFLDSRDSDSVREATWWVQIKTRAGVTGWTRETAHFTGADRCG